MSQRPYENVCKKCRCPVEYGHYTFCSQYTPPGETAPIICPRCDSRNCAGAEGHWHCADCCHFFTFGAEVRVDIPKAGEPEDHQPVSPDREARIDALVSEMKAGECEHEWAWNSDINRFECERKYCFQTRTVADFWRPEPPEHPNPQAQFWALTENFWYGGFEHSTPELVDKMQAEKLRQGWAVTLFFDHPDYIIEPPPVPDDEE